MFTDELCRIFASNHFTTCSSGLTSAASLTHAWSRQLRNSSPHAHAGCHWTQHGSCIQSGGATCLARLNVRVSCVVGQVRRRRCNQRSVFALPSPLTVHLTTSHYASADSWRNLPRPQDFRFHHSTSPAFPALFHTSSLTLDKNTFCVLLPLRN